jgi:hypothetical protein
MPPWRRIEGSINFSQATDTYFRVPAAGLQGLEPGYRARPDEALGLGTAEEAQMCRCEGEK